MTRAIAIVLPFLIVTTPAAASADAILELEGQLTAGSLQGVSPQIGVGLILGEHAVVLTGLRGGHEAMNNPFGTGESISSTSIAVPVELKVYLGDRGAGAVVPLARAGIQLGYESHELGLQPTDAFSIGATILVGAAYFVDEVIGVELELGGAATHFFDSDFGGVAGVGALGGLSGATSASRTSFGFTGRVGVVLRL